MSRNWRDSLVDRLLAAVSPEGGWAYNAGMPGCTEPTCHAILALIGHDVRDSAVDKGLTWLAQAQRPDGGLPVSGDVTNPCWPTGLAVLAFLASSDPTDGTSCLEARKSVEWLLSTRGLVFKSDPRIYGHDTTLSGWPWVEDTHTWLEPTAYAVLALRAAGQARHSRVREGIRLIFDRTISGGGWNYGNRRMFANDLRPFPGTTGIVLAALAGEPAASKVDTGIDYLTGELERVRSPMSLGWGLIGLAAWNRRPPESEAWLEESAGRALRRTANPLEDALLLIAGASNCPIGNASGTLAESPATHHHG